MAITLVGQVTDMDIGYGTTIAPSTSIAVLNGDFVVVMGCVLSTNGTDRFVGGGIDTAAANTAGVGAWTNALKFTDGTNSTVSYAWITSDGNFRAELNTGSNYEGGITMMAFRGVDADNPFAVSFAAASGVSATPTGTSQTPTAIGDWHLGCLVFNSGGATTITPTSGWTQIGEDEPASGYFPGIASERFEATDLTARAPNPTLSNSREYNLASAILRDATGSTPGAGETIARGLYL